MQRANKEILIASSSLDRPTWQPVAENLTNRGYDVFAYESDRVAIGETSLLITISEDNGLQVRYDDQIFSSERFSAAWRRRPSMFIPGYEDWTKQFQIDEERKHMQSILWSSIPDHLWLNSPSSIRKAEDKIGQLLVAKEVGFNIPKTVVTNNWDDIDSELPESIILKMHFGVIYDKEAIQALYTTRFINSPDQFPKDTNPFPGFWQPYLEKAKEWRITVVGEDTFDVAIYTDQEVKDDWRRPEYSSGVSFTQEDFPDEEKQKCHEFLGHYGLKFGAFDFVQDNDGRITFLECNSNGQFIWIEQRLGLPISIAVADQLIKIAKES